MSFSIELEERCSGKSSCFKNLALFRHCLCRRKDRQEKVGLSNRLCFLGDSASTSNLTPAFKSIYYNVALYALDAQFSLFDGSLLRFSFPNMSGIYTFMSCSFGTIPFKKERIVKPAESLSVKISIPLVSAKRRISFCLFLSLNIPNPSVSIIRYQVYLIPLFCHICPRL